MLPRRAILLHSCWSVLAPFTCMSSYVAQANSNPLLAAELFRNLTAYKYL